MRHLSIFFFFVLTFSITEAQHLEQKIMAATDAFIAHSNSESLKTLNKQIAIFEPQLSSENEYYEFIYLLVNKAYYLKQNNQLTDAIATYEKAYALYKKHKVLTFDIVEYCLIDLGILYHRTTNYTNAENTIKQYLFIAEKNKNETQQLKGAKNLANLYQKLGKHQSAIAIVDNALKLKALTPGKRLEFNQLKIQSKIALKKSENFPVVSTPVEHKNIPEIAIETAYLLAKQNKQYEEALTHFNALKNFRNTENQSVIDIAKSKFEEGQLYFLLGDNTTCAVHLKAALHSLIPNAKLSNGLPEKNKLFAENTFIDIFDLLAELQTTPENIIACYELSFYVSELLETSTDQKAQLVTVTKNRNRSERCISVLYNLDNPQAVARAFYYAERHKAAVLQNIITKKSLLERYPKDSLLVKQQALLKRQEALQFQLLKMPFNVETAAEINSIRDQVTTISLELKTVNLLVEKKYPSLQTQTSFKAISQKLKTDDALLVEYFFGKANIYQFVISETTAKLTKIPLTESTRQHISNFIDYFNTASAINNNIPKYTDDAFELYKILQLNQAKSKQNLIIIPDGFLNFIPFDALLTEKTNTLNFQEMPFMVKAHKLAYQSNTALYLKSQQQTSAQKILGVFPVFKNTNFPLNYSVDEAKSIEKEMAMTVLMHNQATKEAFLSLAKSYTILHLSTHAGSGDFIEPASITFIDSKLYLNDLYGLDLNADLVVLSACETGVGLSQRGEGVMSVARGFQYAGVKNSLFSLWQISDLSTSQLMALFYRKYKVSSSAFEANHFSKLAYLNDDTIKNIKKSPYYWSAFIYQGTLTKPKEGTSNLILILFVSAGIILLLLLLYKLKYGKRFKRLSS